MPPPNSKIQDEHKKSPIRGAFVPILSDTIDLQKVGLGLYVGVAGDVKVRGIDGSDYTMVGLVAGVWHPCEIVRVFSTGTAATSILVGNG